jgi:hypothetical protein
VVADADHTVHPAAEPADRAVGGFGGGTVYLCDILRVKSRAKTQRAHRLTYRALAAGDGRGHRRHAIP